MRAWVVNKKGFDHLELVDNFPIPKIQNDYDVVIKNIAVGLNPDDYKRCNRDHPPFKEPPFLIGGDGCGIIEKIGSAVDPGIFGPGKLVYYVANIYERGCFSDYTVQDSRTISLVPQKIVEGKDIQDIAVTFASLPISSFTAYVNICMKLRLPIFSTSKQSNPKIYKNILVTSGSGGVGGFCLQLLSLWRSTLPDETNKNISIITICPKESYDVAKSYGATHIIDFSCDDLPQKVMELTHQEGIDAFIDTTGGTTLNWAMEVLNNGADYVTDHPIPAGFDMSHLFFRSQNIHQTYLPYMYMKNLPHQLSELKKIGNIMGELISEDKIKSKVSQVVKFDDIKHQLINAAQFHSKGQVVALL